MQWVTVDISNSGSKNSILQSTPFLSMIISSWFWLLSVGQNKSFSNVKELRYLRTSFQNSLGPPICQHAHRGYMVEHSLPLAWILLFSAFGWILPLLGYVKNHSPCLFSLSMVYENNKPRSITIFTNLTVPTWGNSKQIQCVNSHWYVVNLNMFPDAYSISLPNHKYIHPEFTLVPWFKNCLPHDPLFKFFTNKILS